METTGVHPTSCNGRRPTAFPQAIGRTEDARQFRQPSLVTTKGVPRGLCIYRARKSMLEQPKSSTVHRLSDSVTHLHATRRLKVVWQCECRRSGHLLSEPAGTLGVFTDCLAEVVTSCCAGDEISFLQGVGRGTGVGRSVIVKSSWIQSLLTVRQMSGCWISVKSPITYT